VIGVADYIYIGINPKMKQSYINLNKMNSDLKIILYFYYCIEKKIIDKAEIIQWADNMISDNDEVPFYIIELSLANSLDEQYLVLDNSFPRINLDFKKLPAIYILGQLYKLYKLGKRDILDIINIIFHLKYDIDMPKNLLREIYLLDNNKDLYLQKVITLDILSTKLISFLEINT